jgi:hypothetical protein
MTDAAPSTVTEDFWVHVAAPGSLQPTRRTGKWLLFTPAEDHNAVWAKVRAATEAGELGIAAKASTARPNPHQGGSGALLTCVYTHDYENHDDVRHVLASLRKLGFDGRLSYKTDDDTLSGKYGRGAAIYVSQPGSPDFEDRRQ